MVTTTPATSVRRPLLPALLATLLLGLVAPGQATAKPEPGSGHDNGIGRVVTVMTRNVYLGADLMPAITATSLDGFVDATGGIVRSVDANDFATRAEGLAEEILALQPDLVGLQEVALWRTAAPNLAVLSTGPSATTVRYDYLQLLLDELNARRPQYEVVISQDEFDLEAPADANGVPGDGPAAQGIPDAEINARLTMRDVILARIGAGIRTANEDAAHFTNSLSVPILGGQLPVARGWVSTDAKVRGGGWFRFVNTHLEAFHPGIRLQQAGELVAPGGPATSDLPVVLVGDLNSDDDTVTGNDRLAYQALLAAGMVARSTDDPLSCCLASDLLAVGQGGHEDDFDHQVDHIMTRDPAQIVLQDSYVTGLDPVNGFWNSDHAGVTSDLRFTR